MKKVVYLSISIIFVMIAAVFLLQGLHRIGFCFLLLRTEARFC